MNKVMQNVDIQVQYNLRSTTTNVKKVVPTSEICGGSLSDQNDRFTVMLLCLHGLSRTVIEISFSFINLFYFYLVLTVNVQKSSKIDSYHKFKLPYFLIYRLRSIARRGVS